jgi:Domain of unknown function (DUF4389)
VSETLQAVDAPDPHPIRMVVTDDLVRSRPTVFFRLLLAIPQFIWVTLWSFAVVPAAVVAWVIGLVTGRVPDGLHSFMAAYTRYYTHLDAYLWIAADPYPGFTGEPGYPVDVEIAPATSQNRLTIFFRLLLAIPAAIVMSVLQNVAWIVAILAWFYALVTGRMSKGMRDLQVYCLRYQAQTFGYLLLLTQRYPSFSDE